MESKIKIEPLSKKTLKPAIRLLQNVFDYPEGRKQIKLWFTASLNPDKYQKLYEKEKSKWVQYYVALHKNKIIGTTGLYQLENEKNDVYWLGWFCVDERYRRSGIGREIIDFTFKEERKLGGKVLKLWTTNHPEMEAASKFYKKLGFRVVKRDKIPKTGFNTIYLSRKI